MSPIVHRTINKRGRCAIGRNWQKDTPPYANLVAPHKLWRCCHTSCGIVFENYLVYIGANCLFSLTQKAYLVSRSIDLIARNLGSISFNERVRLIVEHEQGSGRERAQMMASEERELSDLFRRAEMDYEARLSSQVRAPSDTAGSSYASFLLPRC